MFADTVEFHILSIEPEARPGIETEIAKSRRSPHLVHDAPFGKDAGTHFIDIGMVWRPKTRVPDLQSHLVSLGIEDRVLHFITTSSHLNIDLDATGLGIGHHMDAPVTHMDGLCLDEPHMAVDATARVPARVGLVAIVDTHGNDIVATAQIARDVILKRTITIGTESHLLAIDIDGGVHIDPVELDEIKTGVRDTEVLAIPADTARERSPTRPRRIGSQEVALDGPVMGQVQATPVGVVVSIVGHRR